MLPNLEKELRELVVKVPSWETFSPTMRFQFFLFYLQRGSIVTKNTFFLLKPLPKNEQEHFMRRQVFDVQLCRIRKALKALPGWKLETYRGRGWKLIVPGEEVTTK